MCSWQINDDDDDDEVVIHRNLQANPTSKPLSPMMLASSSVLVFDNEGEFWLTNHVYRSFGVE